MKWNKYSIQTTTEAVDFISSMLGELGIEGIEIEDNVQLTQEEAKTMFVDFIPDLPPDDGSAKVNFYIDSDEDDNTIMDKVKDGLEELRLFCNVGAGTISESQTEDKDWINNWKQYWHTFTIGDLYIKPTWEPLTEEMKGHAVLSIDPGTAFGTGSHETTRMVILQLQKYIKGGEEVLDVGCGSGILSVVALKYGASMHLAQTLTRMRLLLPMKMQSRTTFLPHSWKSLKEISLTTRRFRTNADTNVTTLYVPTF